MLHNYEIKRAVGFNLFQPFLTNENALKISFETGLVRAFGRLVLTGFCCLVIIADI